MGVLEEVEPTAHHSKEVLELRIKDLMVGVAQVLHPIMVVEVEELLKPEIQMDKDMGEMDYQCQLQVLQ
tara:strand:+ start:408 stop:614 length:207 start_codon:yes stop_codon:yes gene_type:complete